MSNRSMNRGRGRQGFNKRGQAKNNKAPPAAHFPPPLKAIFVGTPPLLHKPPMPRKTPVEIGGVSDFVKFFETTKPPPREKGMTADEKKEARQEKKKELEARMAKEIESWDPNASPEKKTVQPLCTLFVARLDYQTTEKDLRELLSAYGSINSVKLVHDLQKKPRGYAFVEYAHEDSVRDAYRRAEGSILHGRRIRVDVERGRTVPGWKPRRLGGGKGSSRSTKASKRHLVGSKRPGAEHRAHRNSKYSKRMRDGTGSAGPRMRN